MFAVLTEVPAPHRGWLARRRARKSGVFPLVTEKRVQGARYYLIESETGDFGRNWELIKEVAGDANHRILFPRGLIPRAGMIPCKPTALQNRLFQNGVMAVLKAASIPAGQLKIALFDPDGFYTQLAGAMLTLTDYVYVVTQRAEKYVRKSDEFIKNLGILPIVTKDQTYLDTAAVTVAPSGLAGFAPPGNSLLFAPEAGGLFTDSNCLSLPAAFCAQTPPQIAPVDFAGALYEFCAVYELGTLIPSAFTDGFRKIPIPAAAQMVAQTVNQITK